EEQPMLEALPNGDGAGVVAGVLAERVVFDIAIPPVGPDGAGGRPYFLVHIVLPPQVRALRPLIAGLDGHAPADLALHREVPTLQIRRWRVQFPSAGGSGPADLGESVGERIGQREPARIAGR